MGRNSLNCRSATAKRMSLIPGAFNGRGSPASLDPETDDKKQADRGSSWVICSLDAGRTMPR